MFASGIFLMLCDYEKHSANHSNGCQNQFLLWGDYGLHQGVDMLKNLIIVDILGIIILP